MTRSIEMSFSASRLFSADTSMSIGFLLAGRATAFGNVLALPGVIGVELVETSELHLHSARPKLAQAEGRSRSVDLQGDAILTHLDDSTLILNGTSGRIPFRILLFIADAHDDQPSEGAPPVSALGERPIDARRGHLER